MEAPPVSLGYVILYVDDVAAALAFYEEAFSLTRRFFHDDNGKAYGELETGATRLAFASLALDTIEGESGRRLAKPGAPWC
jgi:catechol 2,3-dioxygenase-like lactoylglutathione lyase family enzyme